MATSWGIDPLKDGTTGVVTIGTTAADLRQIQGGLYTPGLISGGTVTRSSSAHTYSVSAGVAAFPIVTGTSPQTTLGPIPSTVVTITPPASGSTTYIIYAQQHTVAANGDPNIVVTFGTTLPVRSVALGTYIISSSTTNSNGAVKTGNISYSIPYGASLGLLYKHTATANWSFTGRGTDGSGSFFLPTDRLIRISLTSTLSAVRPDGTAAVGFDNAAYSEAGYDIFLDGVKIITWTSPGLNQAWAEYFWSTTTTIAAGSHTISYERYKAKGPGNPYIHGDNSKGNDFLLEDIGPIV